MSMLQMEQDISGSAVPRVAENSGRAIAMACIAFINMNVAIGCVWGSFSVLLGAVEARLGVGRDLSTLAAPAINLSQALCAPVIGILAVKYPLRPMLLAGSLFLIAGFTVLAFTKSYPVYLIAFGLLLAPGIACGMILPTTLVTRWFLVNRGKALGIVTAPIFIGVVPLISTFMLQSHGLTAAFLTLAAISMMSLIANFFVLEQAPAGIASTADPHGHRAAGGLLTAQLLRQPGFWRLALAFIASTTGSFVMIAHLIPMARSWGLSTALAASLFTAQAIASIAGTIVFGWVGDRLGGPRSLALLVFNTAVLWLLLLLHPNFIEAVIIIGLLGAHNSSAIAVLGLALSEVLGRKSFSRAYGLVYLVSLPFSVACVPVSAWIFTHTGNYVGVILLQAAFLGLGTLLAMSAAQRRVASTHP